ncbi:MAG: hypothetical protein ACFFCZ_00885 [Promethearchaeota archaeon]
MTSKFYRCFIPLFLVLTALSVLIPSYLMNNLDNYTSENLLENDPPVEENKTGLNTSRLELEDDNSNPGSAMTSSAKSKDNTTTKIVMNTEDLRGFLGKTALKYQFDQMITEKKELFRSRIGGAPNAISSLDLLLLTRLLGFETEYGTFLQLYDRFELRNGLDSLKIEEGEQFAYVNVVNSTQPSIAGTFGVLNSYYILRARFKSFDFPEMDKVQNFLFSKYDADVGAFGETGATLSLETTYQAVELFTTFDMNLTDSHINQIKDYIESKWTGQYFDDVQSQGSAIADSWYACSILNYLGSINDTNYLNQYTVNLTAWLQDQQTEEGNFEKEGSLKNEILSQTAYALLTLELLGTLQTAVFNLTQAIDFISKCQYNDSEYGDYVGGFSNTINGTLTYVRLSNTRLAVQAFYTIGLFENTTEVTVKTTTPQKWGIDKENEIIQGKETDLYVDFDVFNSSSFNKPPSNPSQYIIEFEIDDPNQWNVTGGTFETGTNKGYLYTIEADPNNNWTLGPHSVSGTYIIDDLPIFTPKNISFTAALNVRLDITLEVNKTTGIKPGETLHISMMVSNVSLTNNSQSIYMNASTAFNQIVVQITTPNSVVTSLPNSDPAPQPDNIYDLLGDTTTINFTIPDDALLGHWQLNVRNPGTIIHSEYNISLRIDDTVYLTGIEDEVTRSLFKGESNLYPGDPINFNFTFEYRETHMFPTNANGSITFVSTKNSSITFIADLIPLMGNKYKTNASQKVPSRLILGNFTVKASFTWNLTTGPYQQTNIVNNTLINRYVYVVGTPIAIDVNCTTGQKTIDTLGNITAYYGESTNITLKLAILKKNSNVSVLEEDLRLKGGVLFENGTIRQIFRFTNISSPYYSLFEIIDPNLMEGMYEFGLFARIEPNNTDYRINNIRLSTGENITIRFKLEGDLVLRNIEYITDNVTRLDKYHVFLALFQVYCPQADNNVSRLDLWGQLSSTTTNFTEQIPDIGYSEKRADYQIWVSLRDLEIDLYKIEVFTRTGKANNTYIGMINFELIEMVGPGIPEIPPEALLAGVIVIVNVLLLYLNIRQYRSKKQKSIEETNKT